jgi:hypothetical protein
VLRVMNRSSRWFIVALLASGSGAGSQSPVRIAVDTAAPEFAVPADFVGLGFETKSVVRNAYGVPGSFFLLRLGHRRRHDQYDTPGTASGRRSAKSAMARRRDRPEHNCRYRRIDTGKISAKPNLN